MRTLTENALRHEPTTATAQKVLLASGIASSALYLIMNVLAVLQFQGYSPVSQSVSELSAIGAPSRPLWVALGRLYNVLVIAFAWGAWRSAGPRRALRVVALMLFVYAAIGFAWPPMHLRGEGFTLTDLLHIVFAMIAILLMPLSVGFGATALGKRFRTYSIATLVVQVVSGILTGVEGPRIAANLPTPWVGLSERIFIGVFLLWVVVLAVALRGERRNAATDRPGTWMLQTPGGA